MARTVDMTEGNIAKHLLRFSFPLILTNLGQQLYMIVDAVIVGRGVGVKALASVGATDWIYWMVLWSVMGMTQGFSTFISRYFGEKNEKAINKTLAMSIYLCAAISLLLTVVGLLCARPLLLLLNTPSDILEGAITYLSTMIAGTLIVAAYNMASAVLRALGDGKTPLIAMGIAALLNIGLDLLFVLVFRIGIFGAALASVISQLVSFFFCLFQIKRLSCIHPDRESFRPDASLIKALLLFSLPLALEHVVISLGGIVLQSSVNLEGSIFIAGYTATNKVYGLLEASAFALGIASSTFLAQNYGAGNLHRFKRGVLTASVISSCMAVFVMVVSYLLRWPLLSLFLDTSLTDGTAALAVSEHYLSIMLGFLVILYLIHIFRNTLQAMKISIWSMISGGTELVVRILMSKLVILKIGADALFLAEPIAWFFALVAVILPYFYYRKRRLSSK